ncbi:MAG: hypothetical protein ABL908_17700 [Hyphomicrobium sp.]
MTTHATEAGAIAEHATVAAHARARIEHLLESAETPADDLAARPEHDQLRRALGASVAAATAFRAATVADLASKAAVLDAALIPDAIGDAEQALMRSLLADVATLGEAARGGPSSTKEA